MVFRTDAATCCRRAVNVNAKSKGKANQPEKMLKIKDFMKYLKLNSDKGTTFIKNIF